MDGGDQYRKGRPRSFRGPKGRSGKNLDDVLRDILIDLKRDHTWSQEEMAEQLGIAQSSLSRKLKAVVLKDGGEEQGFTLRELSSLCNAIDHSPLQLFALHPEYGDEAREMRVFPKDYLFRRYNTLLRTADARGLLEALAEADRLGVLDEAIDDVRRTVEKAHKAVSTAARRKRNSAPTSRKRRISGTDPKLD